MKDNVIYVSVEVKKVVRKKGYKKTRLLMKLLSWDRKKGSVDSKSWERQIGTPIMWH